MSNGLKKYGLRVVLLLLIIVLAGKYFGFGNTNRTQSDQGENAYTASKQIEASQGSPTWILFRSSTCSPCIEMQGIFDKLQPEFKDRVQFVAVDVNDPENSELVKQYQIRYIPTTFLVDKHGEVFFQEEA